MLEALIWAGALVVLGGVSLYLGNNRIKEAIDLKRSKQSLDEDEQRTEILERENQAKLDAATASERTEHEKARLLQEIAEANAAARVAEDPETIAALLAEEKQVIAGRAEGRALAAKEQGFREHSNDPKVVEALVDAYKTFLARTPTYERPSFDQWLGTIEIDSLR